MPLQGFAIGKLCYLCTLYVQVIEQRLNPYTMYDNEKGLYVAHGPKGPISILGKMANRHGLISGATGTGKTVTLQVLAESFCQAGVKVITKLYRRTYKL